MLRNDLLDAFIKQFFGYGDLNAPLWFIGMEEGGEHETDHFNALLKQWDQNGRPQTTYIGHPDDVSKRSWFGLPHPPLQPTWRKLIRIILHATGEDVTNERIRSYQSWELARPKSEACLLELMPLPSQKTSSWSYGERSKLSYLTSRKEYMDRISPIRTKSLRDLIRSNQPVAVVFYGTSYMEYWRRVAGDETQWTKQPYGWRADFANTQMFCVKHPVAPGTTNEMFDQVGRDIQPHFASTPSGKNA